MKRPKVRLSFMLELIAALAVGFGLVRWVERNAGWDDITILFLISAHGSAILSGFALVECGLLMVESLRGQRLTTWGPGRWVLAFSGLTLILGVVDRLALMGLWFLEFTCFSPFATPSFYQDVWEDERGDLARFLGSGLISGDCFPTLLASLIAIRLARWPGDPTPDAREWSGRAWAIVLLTLAILSRMSDILFAYLGLHEK